MIHPTPPIERGWRRRNNLQATSMKVNTGLAWQSRRTAPAWGRKVDPLCGWCNDSALGSDYDQDAVGSEGCSLATEDVTRDAVLLIPGIMGSELVDTETSEVVWGGADLSWYVSSWTTGRSMRTLAVTEAERAGATGRIRPTRLLRFPAAAPFLRGFEPYTDLLSGLRRVAPHAVAEFPYDWRLSLEHNAHALARAADEHLTRWRAHPQGSADARLVLVAHSMGGLIARYFTGVLGGAPEVRITVALGTPYYGAVKAAEILNSGRGAPVLLPRKRLRTLAATLPGLHDLLPSYRCLDEGAHARRLTPADVAALGGDATLAEESFASREQLLSATTDVRVVVGVEQPTTISLRLAHGVVTPEQYVCEMEGGRLVRVNRHGDSTVYRDAATPPGVQPSVLPQRHGSIARTPEAIAFVRAVLTERPLGPPLAGLPTLGVDVPDVVAVGTPFAVRVTNTDDRTGIGCVIEHAATRAPLAHPELHREDGTLVARSVVRVPGVYRVCVKRGGASAVSDLVIAVPPEATT
jgi:hypothetical protein